MNTELLQQIADELHGIPGDFKATVLAAELLDNGVSRDEIFFRNLSSFRRFVSKDVEEITVAEDNRSGQIVFHVNREGLYDMLPEGMTHGTNSKKDSEDAAAVFSKRRTEEREARNFFSPLENEFLHRYLQLEVIERQIFNNSDPQSNRRIFTHFFNGDRSLSDADVLALIHILPLSERIRNNTKLISAVMTKLLRQRVEVGMIHSYAGMPHADAPVSLLGSSSLGVDSILSGSCELVATAYHVNVYDVVPGDFLAYFFQGAPKDMLDTIIPFFFSAGADVVVHLHAAIPVRHLKPSSDTDFSFLGFNSYI